MRFGSLQRQFVCKIGSTPYDILDFVKREFTPLCTIERVFQVGPNGQRLDFLNTPLRIGPKGLLVVEIEGTFGKPLDWCSLIPSVWQQEKFTDLLLVSNDGQEFRCHRLILSVVSPVFDRMLSHDFQEGASAQVHLQQPLKNQQAIFD